MKRVYTMSEAADLLGISVDTVRRITISGKLRATPDLRGHRKFKGQDLAAYVRKQRRPDQALNSTSARNRLAGIVTDIKKSPVMAQVEIQAGPHRIVSLLSRESLDTLGLRIGDSAAAVIQATTVIVEAHR
jgi:molybdopterin-binding protein